MKNIIYLLFVLALVSCQSGNKKQQEEKTTIETASVIESTINIGGMHCDMCVASIKKGVNEIDGVVSVEVVLADSTAVVSFDESKVELAKIEEAIEKRGYSIKTEM